MIRKETRQIVKYGVVGVINTLITYVGFLLLRRMGTDIDIANAIAYAAGMINAFLMNRRWTFRAAEGAWWRQSALFVAGCGLCWGIQWAVFRALLCCLPEWAAMGLAMGIYTVAGYAFNRCITFRTHASASSSRIDK